MRNSQLAFTLIEAMIVAALISVCALIAIPGLQTILKRGQDDALYAELARLITTAGNEARLLHKTVSVCKSNDLRTCGGDWSHGQIAFVDENDDGAIHQTSQILAVSEMSGKRGKLHVRFFPRYRDHIAFHPVATENTDNGTLWYCRDFAALPSFAMSIDKAGSVHKLVPDADGAIRDATRKILAC
jgi:Tfp pilus assembly protein FimT